MDRITKEFDKAISEIGQLFARYPFEDKEMYVRWLRQQYHLVKNSTRYLAMAASRVDPENSKEFKEWIDYITEEFNHDLFIVQDLKHLGKELREEPYPIVRAIIANQYYDIENYGHNSLYGYATMLEGLTYHVGATLGERVAKTHGKKAAVYINAHVELDQDHYPHKVEALKKFSEKEQNIIIMNLRTMKRLYACFLEDLMKTQNVTDYKGMDSIPMEMTKGKETEPAAHV